ncbi:kinase-like domain-containing protein [Gigaspora rosea]|uniref:Kinase-like domain-containing protein n=1 Tax=Gigaspora rosea TaxID=44941 RepID=A0A397W8Y2_9GLOM|nr:kinase-like domain-containing protein [Gigaspora rosea]
MIEWIPFDRLVNIQKIEKSLYSATWLDGIRKIDGDDYNYMRKREPSCIVALKALYGSEENPLSIKEFDNYINCSLGGIKLRVYGLTQNPETKEYIMVYQYFNNGSLNKFLTTNFRIITWQAKLKILFEISDDLSKIHKAGYIHSNLTSNKILLDQNTSTSLQSSISGLRLSKKNGENNSGSVYGIMPYIAPEVFLGQGSTQAADIYSFGVIMSEMTTGRRPFGDYQYNIDLSMKIVNGLRPDFAPGTPSCYIELAKQCMESDPQNRPSALDINRKLEGWNKSMEGFDNAGEDEIRKQFLDADKIVKT